MTLLDRSPTESCGERSVPVLATERLILRAPCFEDARTIAALVNDRRIAENTLRIPHPYGLADAQSFITAANTTASEIVFLIGQAWRRRDRRLRDRPVRRGTARDRLLARRSILGPRLRHRSRARGDRSRLWRPRLRRGGGRRAGGQPGVAPRAGKMRIPVDGRRPLSHPRARLIRASRSFSSRPQAVGHNPRRQA